MVIWSQLLISSEAHDPDRHPVASRHYARIGGSHRNRDGRYDVDLLETSLKDIVGNDRRLFDGDRSGISGQKVAVTATTLSNASTYIFSNYNGNTRDRGCGTYLAGLYSRIRTNSQEVINMFGLTGSRMSLSSGKRKRNGSASKSDC